MAFDKSKITISDIKSPGVPIEEYIDKNEGYRELSEQYSPNREIIEKLVNFINENDEKVTIAAFGADWCKDCRKHIPELAAVVREVKPKVGDRLEVFVYGGIKTKPMWERKPGEVIWKSPPSPQEVNDKRFDLRHIPAFFIFRKDGTCAGKIDEHPNKTGSMEGDILHYLTSE